MKIVLRIDGQDKTFLNDYVEAINFRNALELNKEFAKNNDMGDVATFDKIVEFVVKAFNQQFSVEDVWNGLPITKIQSEPMRIFSEVLSLGGLELIGSQGQGNDEEAREVEQAGK